jgi:hypothetical protein
VSEDVPPMARARKLAKERCLLRIDFLDKAGRNGARGKLVAAVELQFEGGAVVKLTTREMGMLRDVHFNLKAKG